MGICQSLCIGDPVNRDTSSQAVEPIHDFVFQPFLVLPGHGTVGVIHQGAKKRNSRDPGSHSGDDICTPKTGDQQVRFLGTDQANQTGNRQGKMVGFRNIQKNKPDTGFFIFPFQLLLGVKIHQSHLRVLRKPRKDLQMASLRPGIHQGILGKQDFQLRGVKFLLQRGCLP